MGWWLENETLIRQICVFAIAAASLQLTLNAGVFSLLSGATWLIGAYAAAIAVREGGTTLEAIVAGVALGGAVAVSLSLATRRLSGIPLAMSTLALVLLVGIGIRSIGDFTGGALGLYGIPVKVTTEGALAAAVGVAVLLALVERGRTGRAIAMMREDVHVAAAVGLPVARTRHALMALSGALAGLSGALYALMFHTITPTQGGFDFILLLLSIVIIGGVRSWKGAYVGAALLTWLPDFSSMADRWNGVLYGVTLVAIVTYAPGGLLGLGGSLLSAVARRLAVTSPEPAAGQVET